MDDAHTSRSPRLRLEVALALTLAAFVFAGLSAWLAPRLIPALPLYEARADRFTVRGRRAEAVEAVLRARYADRVAARDELAAARAHVRSALADRFPPGPLPAQSRAAACAAELRGVALVLEALAAQSPRAASPEAVALPAPLAAVREAIAGAARAGDPAALDAFCNDEQSRWSAWLVDRVRRTPAEHRAEVWSEWAAQFNARARELETQAWQTENLVTPFQLQKVPMFSQLRALAIEPSVPDPSRALIEFPAAPPSVVVRPVLRTWSLLLLAGAAFGLCFSAAIFGVFFRRRTLHAAGFDTRPATSP